MAVNGVAPAILADEVSVGGGLVHSPSGSVFDGVKRDPYDEGDPPRPASLQGETRWPARPACAAWASRT